jgi:hypothetical protein
MQKQRTHIAQLSATLRVFVLIYIIKYTFEHYAYIAEQCACQFFNWSFQN